MISFRSILGFGSALREENRLLSLSSNGFLALVSSIERSYFGTRVVFLGQEKDILTLVRTILWSEMSGLLRTELSRRRCRTEDFRVSIKSIYFLVFPSGDVHVNNFRFWNRVLVTMRLLLAQNSASNSHLVLASPIVCFPIEFG